jgi:hypothetical protein
VLHKQLSFWPYKFQLLQELKPNDRPRPWDSCTDVLKHLKEDSLFLDKIVFSDRATFHLSGKVNHHNLIICGSQNPHQIHKHVRDSPKVNVFCAVSRTQVYRSFFPPRLPLWVACTVICWSTSLFHSWMWRVWFGNKMGPLLHYHRDVTQHLNQTFPVRWIGHGSYILWPPRSSDLTPMDFPFWGFVKDNVYIPHRPVDLQELSDRIVNAIAMVGVTVWSKLWDELRVLPGCQPHNQGQTYWMLVKDSIVLIGVL